jgi:hypothetical protein
LAVKDAFCHLGIIERAPFPKVLRTDESLQELLARIVARLLVSRSRVTKPDEQEPWRSARCEGTLR